MYERWYIVISLLKVSLGGRSTVLKYLSQMYAVKIYHKKVHKNNERTTVDVWKKSKTIEFTGNDFKKNKI